MANRLASFDELKDFIAGGTDMRVNNETALKAILDGVSRRIERYLFGVRQLTGELANGLKQAQATGTYDISHFGLQDRDTIFLRRHLNITSVNSVTDDGTALAADDFVLVDGRIVLAGTRKFTSKPGGVSVVYTAGYTETGSGDSLKLSVPEDITMATMIQCSYLWSKRQNVSGGFGVSSVVFSAGGSVVVGSSGLIGDVKDALKEYRHPLARY